MTTLVSVVTPAFRAEEFIEQTVRSVHAQQHRPMEHLVVDDGSPDATAEIVERLSAELNDDGYSLRLIRHPRNMGGAAALKTGFAEAAGEYICWLSADDAFTDPAKTTDQLHALRSGAGLSFCRIFAAGPTPFEAVVQGRHWVYKAPFLDGLFDRWPSWRMLALLFFNVINGSSVMIARDTLAAGGTFDPDTGNIDQDGDLWLRYSALGVRFRAVDSNAVFYRHHSGQVSHQTEAVYRRCVVNRVRLLRALETSGRLAPALRRSWPVLLLILRGYYREWPEVGVQLVESGLRVDAGVFARTLLRRLSRTMHDEGVWRARELRGMDAETEQAMASEEFVAFQSRLDAGTGSR